MSVFSWVMPQLHVKKDAAEQKGKFLFRAQKARIDCAVQSSQDGQPQRQTTQTQTDVWMSYAELSQHAPELLRARTLVLGAEELQQDDLELPTGTAAIETETDAGILLLTGASATNTDGQNVEAGRMSSQPTNLADPFADDAPGSETA